VLIGLPQPESEILLRSMSASLCLHRQTYLFLYLFQHHLVMWRERVVFRWENYRIA